MKKLSIISGIILFLAIPSGWDYSFYIFLRYFICGASLYIAYSFYNSKLQAWALVFGGVAFLYNPLIPVYLPKSAWVSIDLIVAILFFFVAFSERKKK